MKKIIGLFIIALASSFFLQNANAQISIGISISAHTAPPPLPVYTQPVIPGDGYIWTPGYWAYNDAEGYYWVPGVWVRPPRFGLYWTPAYWGFANGVYGFHRGYWGPHVGFYGGINYGYGYVGNGYAGGMWAGSAFRYNTAVSNVNTTIVHNTYVNKTVINNTTVNNRYSFNGPGGAQARPSPQEASYTNEHHYEPTQEQMNHEQNSGKDHNQFASVNHGAPSKVAMDKVDGRAYNQQGKAANEGQITNSERNQPNRQPNHANTTFSNGNRNGKATNGGANQFQQRRAQGVRTQSRQPNMNNNKNRNGGEGKRHE